MTQNRPPTPWLDEDPELAALLQQQEDIPSDELDLSQLEELLQDSPEDASAQEETQPLQPQIPDPSPKKPGRRPGFPSFFSKKKALITCLAAVLVLLLLIAGFGLKAALDPYDNRILPGTCLGSTDVGGLTQGEARKALREATDSTFSRQSMVITLPDGELRLTPEDTGVSLNVRAAVKAAFSLGRAGSQEDIQAALAASQAEGSTLSLLPYLKLEQGAIRSQLEAYAAKHNVAHTELSYRLAGDRPPLEEDLYDEAAPHQTLELTLGTPLEELDVEQVLDTVLQAYGSNQLSVTIQQIPCQSQPAEPDLEAIAAEFAVPAVNTTLDMENYRQIPGAYGYALDLEAGKQLLSQADYGETVSIPMMYVPPEILGDGVYFRDELGYCETKHTTNENRNTNLKLACAALDGLILQPGEEFSYNDTLGQRTKEKGYLPAAAYSGTKTVDSIGGGICQVSSTLYYATLIADMEIVYRINHGFRSSYIGVGLDATVNWGGPDFQFRNNYNFPVMLKAEVSDGMVKVWLYGTDEKDYYVKMTSGYSEDQDYVYAWSYKSKYDKQTDALISKEKEAYSCYMK